MLDILGVPVFFFIISGLVAARKASEAVLSDMQDEVGSIVQRIFKNNVASVLWVGCRVPLHFEQQLSIHEAYPWMIEQSRIILGC